MALSSFIMLCNHHFYLISKHFYHPRGDPIPITQSLSIPKLLTTMNCVMSIWIHLCWIFHIIGTIHCVTFYVCLPPFIIIIYFLNYFIVVQLQLSAFYPHPNPPPSLASTLPLGFAHVSFIVVPENPSPHCPLPHLWLLLDYS